MLKIINVIALLIIVIFFFALRNGKLKPIFQNGYISVVSQYLEIAGRSKNNIKAQLIVADYYYYTLKDKEQALRAYQLLVPSLKRSFNVDRGKHAYAFYNLAILFEDKGDIQVAIDNLNEALSVSAQNMQYQIFMGTLLEKINKDEAIIHYKELLEFPGIRSEEENFSKMKINDLSNQELFKSEISFNESPFYSGFKINIIPINGVDNVVSLTDICHFLMIKYLVGCNVLPQKLFLNEESFLNQKRGQFRAEVLLENIKKIYPITWNEKQIFIAYTGRDIYSKSTNYLFSLQNIKSGHGVISSHRFINRLPHYYEKKWMVTRRVALQFLSTVGQVLGISRPTKPHCPLAYPSSLSEFLQKSTKLCTSTKQQRNRILQQMGIEVGAFSQDQLKRIENVYRKYYLE